MLDDWKWSTNLCFLPDKPLRLLNIYSEMFEGKFLMSIAIWSVSYIQESDVRQETLVGCTQFFTSGLQGDTE